MPHLWDAGVPNSWVMPLMPYSHDCRAAIPKQQKNPNGSGLAPAQMNAAMPSQTPTAAGASSRTIEASISPYGRSAA